MAYENPNICKEIYIPFDWQADDGISLEAYKSKYGIDLEDYFEFDESNDIIRKLKNKKEKLFVASRYGVIPLIIISEAVNNITYIALDYSFTFNESDGAVEMLTTNGIKWNHTDKVIELYEY